MYDKVLFVCVCKCADPVLSRDTRAFLECVMMVRQQVMSPMYTCACTYIPVHDMHNLYVRTYVRTYSPQCVALHCLVMRCNGIV